MTYIPDLYKIDNAAENASHNGHEKCALSSIELNIAQDCNMKCKYCIVNHGTFNEAAGYLNGKQSEQAIDLLLAASGSNNICTVIFFGGEPLLNFDIIRHAVVYAENRSKSLNKKMRYWIITNGTLLDDSMLEFIKEYKINMEISIDGEKATHDSMRPYADGTGTYDDIVKSLPGLLAISDCKIRPRATITGRNTDIKSIIDHLHGLGFAGAALEMVGGEGGEYTIDAAALEQLKKALYELSELFLRDLPEGELKYGTLFLPFLHKLIKGKPTYNYCTAGSSKLSVSVHGELYPCKYFVGLPEYKIGSLDTGIDEALMHSFCAKNSTDCKPGCMECRARLICGGGCSAASAQINGSIAIPYETRCNITKYIIELSIRILNEFKENYPLLYTDPFFMMYLMKASNQ